MPPLAGTKGTRIKSHQTGGAHSRALRDTCVFRRLDESGISRERGHVSNAPACGKQTRIEQSLQRMNCNSNLAFAVHTSRASARTALALTARPELVEGFFEVRRESNVTVH